VRCFAFEGDGVRTSCEEAVFRENRNGIGKEDEDCVCVLVKCCVGTEGIYSL
jgi:hypothetical protein